jgi:transcriptional regulator with XRE-family HTH domain
MTAGNKTNWVELVEKYQQEKGISDEELAKGMGSFPSRVRKMKATVSSPGCDVLHSIGKTLGIEPEEWGHPKIITILIKKGMTKTELANKSGINVPTLAAILSRIESGNGNVRKKDIKRICKSLNYQHNNDFTNLYDDKFLEELVPKNETEEEREKRESGKYVWGKGRFFKFMSDKKRREILEQNFFGKRMSREELLAKQAERTSGKPRT